MNRIDEKTTVPLIWVAIAAGAILGPVVAGSMWVKGVNDRLGRIESALGIHGEVASGSAFIQSAQAWSGFKTNSHSERKR